MGNNKTPVISLEKLLEAGDVHLLFEGEVAASPLNGFVALVNRSNIPKISKFYEPCIPVSDLATGARIVISAPNWLVHNLSKMVRLENAGLTVTKSTRLMRGKPVLLGVPIAPILNTCEGAIRQGSEEGFNPQTKTTAGTSTTVVPDATESGTLWPAGHRPAQCEGQTRTQNGQ